MPQPVRAAVEKGGSFLAVEISFALQRLKKSITNGCLYDEAPCGWYLTLESNNNHDYNPSWLIENVVPFSKNKKKGGTDELLPKWETTAWNCHLLAKQATICFCWRRWEQSDSHRPVVAATTHGEIHTGCISSNNKCHTSVSTNAKLLVAFWH